MTDLENLAQSLLGRVQGLETSEAEKYMDLFRSEESRKFMSRMSEEEKASLAKAGEAAAGGDGAAARRLFFKMMSSKEGSALLKQAMEIHNSGKK